MLKNICFNRVKKKKEKKRFNGQVFFDYLFIENMDVAGR